MERSDRRIRKGERRQVFANYSCWLLMALLCWSNWDLSTSCYIRNCPFGGKRAASPPAIGDGGEEGRGESTDDVKTNPARECLFFGPASDRCYCIGERICCRNNEAGCEIDTELSRMCQLEKMFRTQCRLSGIFAFRCGKEDQTGVCATKRTCCTEKGCEESTACLTSYQQQTQ